MRHLTVYKAEHPSAGSARAPSAPPVVTKREFTSEVAIGRPLVAPPSRRVSIGGDFVCISNRLSVDPNPFRQDPEASSRRAVGVFRVWDRFRSRVPQGLLPAIGNCSLPSCTKALKSTEPWGLFHSIARVCDLVGSATMHLDAKPSVFRTPYLFSGYA